jgi:hypothetical protein
LFHSIQFMKSYSLKIELIKRIREGEQKSKYRALTSLCDFFKKRKTSVVLLTIFDKNSISITLNNHLVKIKNFMSSLYTFSFLLCLLVLCSSIGSVFFFHFLISSYSWSQKWDFSHQRDLKKRLNLVDCECFS